MPTKDAALIDERVRLDEEGTGQGLGDELHGTKRVRLLVFEKKFDVETPLRNEVLQLGKADGLSSTKIIGGKSDPIIKID